jgi:PKD repeat protein
LREAFYWEYIKFKEAKKMKKLLFVVIALAMVLGSMASVFVAPTVATDAESPVIPDLHWWSNVSGSTPDVEFLPTPDINLPFNSNSFTLAEVSEAYGLTITEPALKDTPAYETYGYMIPVSKDTAIGFNPTLGPDMNHGDRISFVAWNDSPHADFTSLLEFNLASIPANAEIYQADLALCCIFPEGSSAIPVGVYKQLHTDWEESQATYNIYKIGCNWATQGGDYVTSNPVGKEMVVSPSHQGFVQWDIIDIVNDARTRGIPLELLVKATEHGDDYSSVAFISKEYSTDPWLQPKLIIGYVTPTTPTPTPAATPWSFAIITDTHVGEGLSDYGGTDWDDDPNSGQEYTYHPVPMCYPNEPCEPVKEAIPSVWNLKIAVGSMNTYTDLLNTKFVVVDGDLTDSAELSEFGKAKEILNKLNIPWIPTIGNHDVWPYTTLDEVSATKIHDGLPYGPEWYFNKELIPAYANFSGYFPSFNRTDAAVLDGTKYRFFANFVFDYEGYHFIGLDFNSRSHAPSGNGAPPWAGYNDEGTWDWFLSYLNQHPGNTKDIILLAHHTMMWMYQFGFPDTSQMKTDLMPYKDRFNMQFAGHLHSGWHGIGKQDYYESPINFDIVKTKANKDDPMVRIVQVYPDGSINYDTLLPRDAASITVHCPVDLTVTDPDGLVMNRSENQVPDAMYYKWDFDEDGQLETKIWIPERKQGLYSIQVIPEPGANASDTFTLTVSPMEQKWGYTPIDIAQNVTISNIPAEPYTFEFKQRMGTNISYTGTVSGYMLDTVNLTAALSTENGSPLFGKTVNFMIGNQSVSAVTDVNGLATASLTLNQIYSGLYDIEYGFGGDTDYLPYYDYQLFVIPPVADAAGPYTGTEGSPVTLNGSGTYDPEGKVISYEWDLDNDGVYDDATGVTPAYIWNDDYSGSIGLRVTDAGGTISEATTTVTINNVPPTVEAGPNISGVLIDSPVSFNGSFTDPGTLDAHTVVWNFGDVSPTVNGTLTPTHTYTTSGNYIVTLTVTDDDGGIGTDTLAINMMPTTTTYTFTSGGGTNKWCSAGHIHLVDWNNGHPHSPADFSASPTYGFVSGGSTEYAKVSSSDNMPWKSNISHDLGCCALDRNAELFTFKIAENPSTITNIQIKWEGHGTTGETIYYTTEKLWKYSNSTWNQLRNQKNVTSDTTWTNNISSGCSDYIESGTGNLSVLVSAQRSGLPNNCGIWTEYIEVSVTHN